MHQAAPPSPTQQAIARELRALLQHHGCDQETADQLTALPPPELVSRTYEVLEILGARPHLLAVVASYGVTLDDEAVLELLHFARPDRPVARLRPAGA
ncbi:MAG: hypothetical protein KF889_17935 [Alphaproteobacteria bacterium]|nr:hypothetical protein [Alphaproteobacteria bacterium]MCW5741334.1 hypothetical protein [Alphaproteobacteria bacterium]